MTCIVGAKYEGGVIIGGDSYAGDVGSYTVYPRSDVKVFRVGEFVIGYTTSYRMGQLLRFGFVPPIHPEGMDDYEYLCTLFIDAVRKRLSESGYASKVNEHETGGSFLLAYRKNLYEVNDDYQVGIPANGYASVGCGYQIAIGAMFAMQDVTFSTRDAQNMQMRVMKALQAAAEFSAYVRAPFTFVLGDINFENS